MATIEEARRRLEGIEGHVAVAIWQREDVLGKAEELGIKITPEQADEILAEMDHRQDAEIGITWDTIEVPLQEFQAEVTGAGGRAE